MEQTNVTDELGLKVAELSRIVCQLAENGAASTQNVVELVQAHAEHTRTLEAMADAIERITKNHGIAFRRIGELLVSLGADIKGPEIAELRRLFDLDSPEVN